MAGSQWSPTDVTEWFCAEIVGLRHGAHHEQDKCDAHIADHLYVVLQHLLVHGVAESVNGLFGFNDETRGTAIYRAVVEHDALNLDIHIDIDVLDATWKQERTVAFDLSGVTHGPMSEEEFSRRKIV